MKKERKTCWQAAHSKFSNDENQINHRQFVEQAFAVEVGEKNELFHRRYSLSSVDGGYT
jgi:hypothetical protein